MSPNFGSLPRRRLLQIAAGATGLVLAAPGLAVAAGPADRKLVVVILRGGLDGLAAVIPYADPQLQRLRGELTPPAPGEVGGARAIGEGFGLHPSLAAFHGWYEAGQAAVMHAAATPYRDRSHFDGQDVLESGGAAVFAVKDGWLNRAVQHTAPRREAVAVGFTSPLILAGAATTTSWTPSRLPAADEETIARLMALYDGDPMLEPALAAAVALDQTTGELGAMRDGGRPGVGGNAKPLMAAAGKILSAEGGPSLAVVSLDGWDTHARQTGVLARNLAGLDDGLAALKLALGALWASSVVIVATEFGRTVKANGTGGSDHGTGAAAFLAGGAVKGGRILGDWPGLSRLHEDRDVLPANDLRSVFKGVLGAHWGLERAALDRDIFPDSAGVAPLSGLIG